jgi:hypothetical protein
VTEDWAAVAKAINERVNELGWRQRELVERSQVSPAIVREIQRRTVERRRSPRTLESLSVALGWHPQHLAAVLHGRRPPHPGEAAMEGDDDTVWSRLDAHEQRLSEITQRLSDITERLDALKTNLTMVVAHVRAHR